MRTTKRRAVQQNTTSLGWEDKAWIDQELEGAYFQDVRLGRKRCAKRLLTRRSGFPATTVTMIVMIFAVAVAEAFCPTRQE
jgi:hypothetical protein